MRLEHKAGTDIIYELAVRLYSSPLEPFREAVSNALDEGTNKVEIQISGKAIIVEDWGEGIEDIESFAKFGMATKAKLGGEIIGQKGLGKLSFLRFGDKVNFRTNNGQYGLDIIMTPKDFQYSIGKASKFLNHVGTRIIIPTPSGIPEVNDLSSYLRKVFGLRIAKGMQIVLNDVSLEPSFRIDPEEKPIFKLVKNIEVTGNIKEDKKGHGSLDFYVRHVFVTSIPVDPIRRFSGWVNCNELIPTTSRNDIVRDSDDGIFHNIFGKLKQYVQKFPKIDEDEITREEELLGNELNVLLKNYLAKMKLLAPAARIGMSTGTYQQKSRTGRKEGRRKEAENMMGHTSGRTLERLQYLVKYRSTKTCKGPDYINRHTSRKTKTPIRRTVRTDYGITWVDQDIGNDKEPIFLVEPNIVVRNRTNDIYGFLIKNKVSLGSKPIRAFPYLARVAVSMNKESPKWDREQLFLEIDKAMRHFLKDKGEI